MSRAEEFIDLYKQLEDAAVQRYGYPTDGRAVSRLEDRREFARISGELSYCREVRNLLQHKPKVRGEFMVEPSREMLQLLRETLDKVKHPVRCRDLCIPFQKMYWKTMEDPVLPSIRQLRTAGHTHIPLLENRRVVGMFTVNGLFSYLAAHGAEGLTEATRFSHMRDELCMDCHPSEIYVFAPMNAAADEVEEHFRQAEQQGRRVGMVILTETGKPTEKVQGILTAWDLVGHSL